MPGSCPRCNKPVYFGDETKALGKTWHKACLRCADCGKTLDSFSMNPLDEDVYCRACFNKHSLTNGVARLKVRSNSFAEAQVAGGPILDSNDPYACPRCGKKVYFAEEKIANGRKWHKLCLKCGACNKLLDSTTLTEHKEDAYCKSCYGKNFGPRGYGFAGGGAGLSMDTGRRTSYETSVEKSRRSSDHFSQAQVPIDKNEDSSGAPRCGRCGKPVYFAEEIVANRKKWHKICLKCSECNKQLDSTSLTEHEGDTFCKNCYGRLFGPSGFGSHGLSTDKSRRRRSGSGSQQSGQSDTNKEYVKVPPQQQTGPSKYGGSVGVSDSCPRCSKPVFFAEERVVNYRKWHVSCVTCAKCNKRLDSATLTEHENEVFCHNCHKKLFGPKGFGFGSLSMDDGTNLVYPNRSNVPATDQAYMAPKTANGYQNVEGSEEYRRISLGGSDVCPRCGQKVYAAEKMNGAGLSWHKTCFNCYQCNNKLDSSTLTDRDGEIFCKACYGKKFGAKGYGYGIGSGTLQTTT